jgi:hypothetical protein
MFFQEIAELRRRDRDDLVNEAAVMATRRTAARSIAGGGP